MSAPLTEQQLAEIEEFLDVWDAAPAHRTRYRDVISSQKSGDPEGGRKLRATTLREMVAEVRRLRGELGTVLGQLAAVKEGFDAQALVERQRLARALADRNDEYDTLRAEFNQFAEVCASHSADRCVEQVAAEDLQAAYDRLGDQAQRIVEAASQFRAERDRLHDALSDLLLGPVGAGWESSGAGDVRSPWILAGTVAGWRRALARTERSERDGEAINDETRSES